MAKVCIVDYNDWIPYEGFAEGSGRSEKIWLQSKSGEIGLFKYPKYDFSTNENTTEHVSEYLAHQIGNVLGIKTAVVQIGNYKGRVGSMSFLINKPNEAIVEGAVFITGCHPDYNLELMQETLSGRYYCFDHLMEISDSLEIVDKWIQMMLFDYLIGNTDRHQNNWAMLVSYLNGHEDSPQWRVCPLYDNGSSLCCYVNESIVRNYLGNDRNRFESLVNTKSRSMIRIDGFKKKRPTHLEVVDFLLQRYSYAIEFSNTILSIMTVNKIDELLNGYDEVLSEDKVKLVKNYLIRKTELLESKLTKVSVL